MAGTFQGKRVDDLTIKSKNDQNKDEDTLLHQVHQWTHQEMIKHAQVSINTQRLNVLDNSKQISLYVVQYFLYSVSIYCTE